MQTVRILNHYRLALSEDRLCTKVLALLVKEAGLKEEDVLTHCEGDSRPDVKKAIDRLYRAHYASNSSPGRWRATELGRDILASLGLIRAINEFLIASQPVLFEHRAFLTHHVTSKSSHADDAALLSLLQVISKLAESEEQLSGRSDALRRILYAAVIGLDRDFAYFGPKAFNSVISRLAASNRLDSSARVLLGDRDWDTHRISRYCRQAFADVDRSNVYLVEGTGAASQVTKVLSWVRLFAAASGRPDPKLRDIALSGSLKFLDRDMAFSRHCVVTAPLWLDEVVESHSARSWPDWASLISVRVKKFAEDGTASLDPYASAFSSRLFLADQEPVVSTLILSVRETARILRATEVSSWHESPLNELIEAARDLASSAERILNSLHGTSKGS